MSQTETVKAIHQLLETNKTALDTTIFYDNALVGYSASQIKNLSSHFLVSVIFDREAPISVSSNTLRIRQEGRIIFRIMTKLNEGVAKAQAIIDKLAEIFVAKRHSGIYFMEMIEMPPPQAPPDLQNFFIKVMRVDFKSSYDRTR